MTTNVTSLPLFIPNSTGRKYQLPNLQITALMPEGMIYNYEVFEEVTETGAGTPLHTHIEQWEILEIIEGKYKMQANEEVFVAEPGSMVMIPPNTPHRFLNINPTPSKLRIILSPCRNFEGFLKEMSSIKGKPDPEVMKKLLNKYGMDLLGGPMEMDQ